MNGLDDIPPGSVASEDPLDFAFFSAQTFHDQALQREILDLFLAQTRRLLPRIPDMSSREQGEAAHLLKGSCQGIGAWSASLAAQAYEEGAPADRPALHRRLTDAFTDVEAAIRAHFEAQLL